MNYQLVLVLKNFKPVMKKITQKLRQKRPGRIELPGLGLSLFLVDLVCEMNKIFQTFLFKFITNTSKLLLDFAEDFAAGFSIPVHDWTERPVKIFRTEGDCDSVSSWS